MVLVGARFDHVHPDIFAHENKIHRQRAGGHCDRRKVPFLVHSSAGYFRLRVDGLMILPCGSITPTVVPCVTSKAASVATLSAPAI